MLCTHTHGLHQFLLALIHGGKNQRLVNKKGVGSLGLQNCLFWFLLVALLRRIAVFVYAWLQSHLFECFVRFQSLFHAHSLHTFFAASTLLCLCTAYLLYFNLVSTSSSSFGVCATYSDLLLLQLCFVFALWFNIDFSLCCLPLAAVPLKDKESLFSTLSDSWPYAPDFAVNLLLPGTQS